uniref:Uncharacterized protein n=1 Tax=Stegastes partitus TaxID=144197 RepID=A0A3B4Z7S2_9TELE
MLSLLSKTLITSCEVPDFGGVPPSTAVSVMVITGCFSRSKAFCSTNSADTLSPALCTFGRKQGGIVVYI